MKNRITKSVAIVALTIGMMLMGTMGIAAEDTDLKLVKVSGEGYKITFRKNNDTIIQEVYNNQNLFLNETEAEWSVVTTADGTITGYIPSVALVAVLDDLLVTRSVLDERRNGDAVVELAKTKIGAPYSYGSSGPDAFDCSGFTTYVYNQFGVKLPRNSAGQAKVGTEIPYSEAIPGDLIAYSGHVAIYVGDGMMIHSPSPGKTVTIATVESSGTVIGVRRLL